MSSMQFAYRSLKALLFAPMLLWSCTSPVEPEEQVVQTERIIEFSGYEWIVRTSDDTRVGPGPNFFSDSEENVWVDEDGRLHLKIVQRGGVWYCSGIILRQSLGYGQYVFYLSSDLSTLDQNVVGGLFTYLNDEEEIDIEFSKWSDPDNQDAQFAVQPSDLPGNKERYDLNLSTPLSTHAFNWQADSIEFVSLQGHGLTTNEDALIHKWTYRGSSIPQSRAAERLRINLWLFRGQVPSDAREHELIVEKVEFISLFTVL